MQATGILLYLEIMARTRWEGEEDEIDRVVTLAYVLNYCLGRAEFLSRNSS